MNKIYYTKPSITDLELKYATDAAATGWGENCYEYIHRFEELFRNHLEADYTLATSSCTGALHMGLSAIGIGAGDEVILADINWIASAAPITYLGATPVLVDVLPDTWCIDPGKIEAAITPKTKAIIAVHLYGNICSMSEILSIAKKHHLYVIEDAAEAIGSKYNEKHAGTIGDFGVFSFHGTKTITTGEGGAFVTDNPDLFRKVSILNSHGRNPENPKQFWAETLGFKYKMSNIQAAIGCAQLERVDDLIADKRRVFNFYKEQLSDLEGISMNPEKSGTINGYWMPTIVFDDYYSLNREELLKIFKKNNVDARVFFYPLSKMNMFERKYTNKTSYSIYNRSINLPSYYDMENEDIIRVVDIIRTFISQ